MKSLLFFVTRSLRFVSAALALAAIGYAQIVTTTAGGFVGDGGLAINAGMNYPRYMLQDASGSTYIADGFDHRIRRVDATGKIRTFAGTGISGFSGDGGPARNAMLSFPTGLLFDSGGNMLVSDSNNNRIRKITPTGIISTIAGNGTAGYSGDGGPALQAQLNSPWALSLDKAGNIFFTDVLNNAIRKIDIATGIITTVAGTGTAGYNGDGIPATQAELNLPRTVLVDSDGNIYIADTQNHRVRKVDTAGTINTFAGNGVQGFSGDKGPAVQAEIGNPRGLLLLNGLLLISNGGQSRIRKVNLTTNIIDTFAGSGFGYDGEGNPALSARFSGGTGMYLTRFGTVLLGDQANGRVRQITTPSVTTLAGSLGRDNVPATQGVLVAPENISFDTTGNYYVAEYGGNRIRQVNQSSGRISTFAGTGITGFSGDGGPANQAQLNQPFGVAADGVGNVYIADTGNALIRKVDATGIITTFATDPTFSDLVSLAVDTAGNLYSADDGACVIRKFSPTGGMKVVVGTFVCGYNGDGIQAKSAELNAPYGVAVDKKGNLYIGDTLNNRIRKVNTTGIITTIAGTGVCGFSGDGGPGTAAMICNPEGVAVDGNGNVFFGDYTNIRLRSIARTGMINTMVGTGISGYNGDNLPALQTNLDGPIAVGVDHSGTLFLLDDVQARAREVH